MLRALLPLTVMFGVVLAGCQPAAETQPPGGTSATPLEEVSVTVGSAGEYHDLLEKHAGKVILVDFWATWCGPCVEMFPHTVELSEKYREQGLATIAVSLNDPEDLDNVKNFLARQNADFDHLLSQDGGGTASMEAFGLNAAVPHYRLYDRQGELRHQWDGEPEGLEEKLAELLAER